VLPNSKKSVLEAIKQSQNRRLEEQRQYRAIIEAALNTPATEIHDEQLEAGGWQGVETLMSGECWPPTWEDLQQFQPNVVRKLSNRRHWEQIEDDDVAFAVGMYSEIYQHTQRIKAMARYFGKFGAINQNIQDTFVCWRAVSVIREIQKSLGAVPKSHPMACVV
jgi:hypothetical protein